MHHGFFYVCCYDHIGFFTFSHQRINVHLLSILHITVQRQVTILIPILIMLQMPPAGVVQAEAAEGVMKQKNSRS